MSALKNPRLWLVAGAIVAAAILVAGVTVAFQPDDIENSTAYHEIAVERRDSPADADVPDGGAKNGCEVNVLPGPYSSDDEGGEVTAASASGEYLLGQAGRDDVLWHEGQFQVLEESDAQLDPVDVNSSGTVIGMDDVGTDEPFPFVYRDGEFHKLSAPDDELGLEMRGINDNGDIIANSYNPDGLEEEYVSGFIWDADDPSQGPREFPGPVRALNEDGDFIGATDESAWKWDAEGDGERIPDRGLSDFAANLRGVVSYSGDWVLSDGEAWNVAEPDDPKDSDIDNIAAVDDTGNAYGAFGDVVDDSATPAGAEIDGTATELPGLSEKGAMTNGRGVNVASEDGAVMAGESMDPDDEDTVWPVTWSCQ